MQSRPRSAADIIRLWPSAEAFGVDLGLKRRGDHARVMMVRGRIPRSYWPQVLANAERRGISLTEADLELAHEGQRIGHANAQGNTSNELSGAA